MGNPRFTWPKRLAFAAVFLVVLALVCRLFWLQPFRDAGRCMEPTLRAGDLFIVNRLSYITAGPQRGDVVLFNPAKLPIRQTDLDTSWIKRVAGIPGDKISIHPPFLYLNGSPLTTPEIFATIGERKEGYKGYTLPEPKHYPHPALDTESDSLTLSENEYFLVGDNTTNSLDSRYFGAVPRAAILGKVLWIAAPSSRRGAIN